MPNSHIAIRIAFEIWIFDLLIDVVCVREVNENEKKNRFKILPKPLCVRCELML